MKVAPTPRQSRYLALALLAAILVLVAISVAVPVRQLHQHYDYHIEDYSDRLARYRRVASMRPDMEKAISSVQKLDSHKYYLKANTATLAAAELQGLVTRIVESQQGRIISSQALPSKEDSKSSPAGPGKISLSLQLNASIVPLQMILHTIETSEPYLFVDQMTVRANQGRSFRPLPGVPAEFGVQLTVSAYALTAGSAKP